MCKSSCDQSRIWLFTKYIRITQHPFPTRPSSRWPGDVGPDGQCIPRLPSNDRLELTPSSSRLERNYTPLPLFRHGIKSWVDEVIGPIEKRKGCFSPGLPVGSDIHVLYLVEFGIRGRVRVRNRVGAEGKRSVSCFRKDTVQTRKDFIRRPNTEVDTTLGVHSRERREWCIERPLLEIWRDGLT